MQILILGFEAVTAMNVQTSVFWTVTENNEVVAF